MPKYILKPTQLAKLSPRQDTKLTKYMTVKDYTFWSIRIARNNINAGFSIIDIRKKILICC